MGQGTGFGGFIGLDQPNLFGLCKRGALQWQFGRYFNDFNLTYTDPRVRQSMVSGSVTLYRTMARIRAFENPAETASQGGVQAWGVETAATPALVRGPSNSWCPGASTTRGSTSQGRHVFVSAARWCARVTPATRRRPRRWR